MNYCLFKLNFLTPVHFGASASARSLESAGMTLCADTIFSALCHEAQRAGGLVELIHAARSGGLLLSDAMPFCGEEFYIPKPALPATKLADSDPSLRKLMKKLRYLPLSLLPLGGAAKGVCVTDAKFPLLDAALAPDSSLGAWSRCEPTPTASAAFATRACIS